MLNPEGHVYIDGALWRARMEGPRDSAGGSAGGMVDSVRVGTAVRVHDVDGAVILVAPLDGGQRAELEGADEGLVAPSEGL
jgi:membrane protein implicated in regulation of membrane protease activity